MAATHILVVEDDRNIRMGLTDTLESEGYRVTAAEDGEEAARLLAGSDFDLVLLDIMMPKKSGYDLCRSIRSEKADLPVIMLTAKSEEIDKVVGLELGADDYVTKPFGVRELLARISAVLRRCDRQSKPDASDEVNREIFPFGNARVDPRRYCAIRGDETLKLSARELDLLQYFRARPNEVLSRERLLDDIWGMKYFGTTRTLDQHVAQLRKKIESDPSRPTVIVTVHGVGYKYDPS